MLFWISVAPGMGNYSIIRTVRVLRPLRTMGRIPGMRPLIRALVRALQPLTNVLVLFTFMLFIFGILGLDLFSGQLRGHCFGPPMMSEVVTSTGVSASVYTELIEDPVSGLYRARKDGEELGRSQEQPRRRAC